MNTRAITTLAFDKVAGTVTFTDLPTLDIRRLVSITNVTRGRVIYNAGVEGVKYTEVTTNVITLQFDTNNGNFANGDYLIAEYITDELIILMDTRVALAAEVNSNPIECLGEGALIIIETKNETSTASLVAKLQILNYDENAYIDVPGAVTAAITTNTSTLLLVHPSVVEAANSKVSYALAHKFRVNLTISGGTFDVKTYYQPLK